MEEADAVERLKLDDGEVRVEIITDPGADWELDDLFSLRFEEIDLLLKIFGGIVFFLLVNLIKSFHDGLLFSGIGYCFKVFITDSEEIESNAIRSGVDIRRENIELVRCENAADFF